ncbi:TPA: gamma-glutamylcyclotransferase [Candidatus Woesearchaeota archaeon]|nr:hypothetical protein [Candidatus Woesearchaeota archaeon]HIH31316.1 gamma-glutamylcyclotransferase [Candidatus Woesearchaeota archaeon]HIH55393.1 gamma-glutamylcyclotransferase [Candidatus Woesearchaeota archaeon]HIJ01585.1 gamma-glutamylcyclotransferase [Candidatus Woesearchaeota archaeon]HIJ14584.1 gamma-glutamylcyclotransferase [Candidatus Woesearchaeota archaeon]
MLASIYSLSNPISTLSRLIYTHKIWVDSTKLDPKGVKKDNIEFLIDQATDRQEERNFVGIMEKYLLLQESVAENIDIIKNNDIVWLGMFNLGLESPLGFFKHVNTDDFCTKTDFATYLMEIYDKYNPVVKQGIENIVFFRHAPFEFPFMIQTGQEGTKIINPFSDSIVSINSWLEKKHKSLLGDYERYYDDDQRLENYNVAESVFSIKKFNEQVNKEPYYLETLYYTYKSKYQDTIFNVPSMDDFKRLCDTAISLNREILKQKYSSILKELNIRVYDGFMTQGNIANDLIEGIIRNNLPELEKHIIGVKLLQDTKNIPIRGVLEPQALNRLSGWLNAKYGNSNEAVIIKQKAFHERHELFTSSKYPYIYAGGDVKDIEGELSEIPYSMVKKLEDDIIKYQVRISPIEVIIYFLNENNFPVHADKNADKSWQKTKKEMVKPLDISLLFNDSIRMTRPSNTSHECPFIKYINVMEREYPFEIEKNDEAISGSIRHKIANELGEDQKYFLDKLGIEPMDRSKYCEVPIKNYYKPTQHDWNLAVDELEKRLSKSNNPLFAMTIDKIEGLQEQDVTIDDGGRPDAVAITGDNPIIIDFKRRVARYYPVQYFFKQASRYGLMVINGLKLDADRIYTVIVQTPFSSTKYLDTISGTDTKEFLRSFYTKKPLIDKGNYRHEKIRIKEIMLNSGFMRDIKTDWIIEWVMNKHLFGLNEKLGMKCRETYTEDLCNRCYANSTLDFRCNYLLTGRQERWESIEELLAQAHQ